MPTKTTIQAGERRAIPLTQGAKMLGIGLSYCYQLIKNNELKTFRIGRRRMVTPQELDAYVQRKQAEAVRRKPI